MRTMTSLRAAFLILALCVSPSQASDMGGLERTTVLGGDARTLGLGSASAGLWGDTGAALAGNPALHASLGRGEVLIFHTPLFEGSKYQSLALVFPTMDAGVFSLSYIDVRTPDIEARDENNFFLETFTYAERKVTAGWGITLPIRGLSVGASARWFHQSVHRWSGESFGADIGLVLHPDDASWTLGLSSQELYDSGIKLVSERETAPRGFRLGGSNRFTLPGGVLTVAAEGRVVENGGFRPSGGLEYLWNQTAAVRGGWDGDHLNLGAGVQVGSWTAQYGVVFQRPAGITHRISAGFYFGKDMFEERKNRKSKEERLKANILAKLRSDSIETYLRSGDQATAEKRFEDAKAEYAKVLAWDPENKEAQDKMAKADQTAREDSIRVKLADAKRLRADGNDLDAMVLYKAVLELDPNNKEATQGLAAAGKHLRDISRKAFTSTAALPAAEAQAYFEKGLEHYLAGRYSQSLEQWKKLVASNPLQRQVFEYVSRAQVRLESDKTEALQKQQAAVKVDRLRLLRQKAYEQYRKGDLKGAIDSWQDVLKTDPNNAEAKSELEKAQKQLQDSMKRGVRW